jgi:hypothetical protein
VVPAKSTPRFKPSNSNKLAALAVSVSAFFFAALKGFEQSAFLFQVGRLKGSTSTMISAGGGGGGGGVGGGGGCAEACEMEPPLAGYGRVSPLCLKLKPPTEVRDSSPLLEEEDVSGLTGIQVRGCGACPRAASAVVHRG